MTSVVQTRILFVCTANQCRSPFAEALARRTAGQSSVVFESAGVESWRRGVPVAGLRHASELGLDLSEHVSRSLMVDELGEYDVLLGMSREHARELLALAPEARARIFTLKQFARWLETHQRPADVDVGTWLDATAGQRSPWDLIGSNPADDVEDPLGQPIDHWRAMTADLQPAIDGVLAGLFPSAPRPV